MGGMGISLGSRYLIEVKNFYEKAPGYLAEGGILLLIDAELDPG